MGCGLCLASTPLWSYKGGMKYLVVSFICVALLATASGRAFARGSDTALDEPPAGIGPTTATLSQVLEAHTTAVGHLAAGGGSVRTDVWTFTKAGAQGSERLVRRGTDYHSIITTGPFTEEYGQSGDARWYMNENGAVTDTTESDFRSFEVFRVLEEASDPKNDVKLLGETASSSPDYVVEVKLPRSPHPEWIYFNKKSSLVTRTEQVIEEKRLVSTYDNYQTLGGLTEPAHIHDSDGTVVLDDDYRRQSVSFSNTVSATEFTKPVQHASFARIDHPVDLKARIVQGTVIIRLMVNNRGLDFELSSGDSHSYIDWDVARELNLPSFGQVTQAERDAVPYETRIDAAWAGDQYLQNFAIEVLPFHYHTDVNTQVVGVLGYDFLSQGLFTVDYVNKRVTASPNTVDPFDPFGAGLDVLPVWFDNGQPFFGCTIGVHDTRNVLLDSSFGLSFVLGSFTQQYPDAVPDLFRKEHMHTVVPFADNGSYGRDADVWIANIPQLQVGPMNFLNYQLLATDMEWERGDHPVDAVIGTQFLQYFDVTYDFAHSRVLLKENDYFHRSFKVSHK